MIVPLIGQVTDAVASSPTAPLRGVHSEINAEKLYAGEEPATGRTVIETAVPTVDVVPVLLSHGQIAATNFEAGAPEAHDGTGETIARC